MLKKVGIILMLIGCFMIVNVWYAWSQEEISDSVLRLHVLANSDTIADQNLKLAVKNQVVEYIRAEFSEIDELEKAKAKAEERIPQIQARAEEVIKQEGYNYPVKVTVGNYEFPTKSYGNFILPQGEYQAVKVTIGAGEGKNWWCVLFPPLCLVSSSDKGLSFDSPERARISLKCLELLPQGAKYQNKVNNLFSH